MTAPRAAGMHLPYAGIPERVRDWVEATLGSPVVTTAEQVGGMSPGCVTRVACADGTRAFVKAVGTDLNADTPVLYRREVLALGLIGSHPLWADLLASYDDGEWVALLLEDVEGGHPDLADEAVMDRLLEATDELGAVLASRVPSPPAPPSGGSAPLYRPGLVDLSAVFTGWLAAFDRATEVDLPHWARPRATDLRAGLAELCAVPTDTFVHYDIRNDNLLQRPSGEIVFVDWGAAGVGPDWQDPLLARLERVHLPWFDASLAGSPALVRAGGDLVTAWLVGVGVHLAVKARTVVDAGLPGMADFRRTESARFLSAAARRLGVD